jgi:undecaprenyl-diphosphatase
VVLPDAAGAARPLTSARRWQSLAVGLAQGCGLRRLAPGCTIAAGLGVGLERAWAARFSFLLSVPAVAGAAAVEAFQHRDSLLAADSSLTWCFLGALVAGVTGYFALKLVLATVQSRHFHR